eukprot:3240991-Rhodomonas_salina.3
MGDRKEGWGRGRGVREEETGRQDGMRGGWSKGRVACTDRRGGVRPGQSRCVCIERLFTRTARSLLSSFGARVARRPRTPCLSSRIPTSCVM